MAREATCQKAVREMRSFELEGFDRTVELSGKLSFFQTGLSCLFRRGDCVDDLANFDPADCVARDIDNLRGLGVFTR